MIPCITIGDSIAVGVGQARTECEIVARVGVTSSRYVATMLPPGRTTAGTAVISLGVNDGDTAGTLDNLRLVRSRVDAGTVVWLLPGLKENVRDMIRTVAEENGDRTLDTRPEVGRDHLHPTGAGYERIAATALGPNDGGVEVADAPEEPRAGHVRSGRTQRHAHALHVRATIHGRAPARAGREAVSRHGARVASSKGACVSHCRGRSLRG